MEAKRVVVVGGGIAGLATAHRLRALARERDISLELILLERDDRCGGKIRSTRESGYLLESGPNGFLDNEPATLRLIEELGVKSELLRSRDEARRRFILRDETMHLLEMNPKRFVQSKLMSWPGKIRMAAEIAVPAKKDASDESVASFGRRRLGKEFTRIFLDSMVSGIFAGDIDRLSLTATFPKMPEMEREHGGLFKALKARRRGTGAAAGPMGSALHSFREGMETVPKALAASLAPHIRTGIDVDAIAREADGLRVVAGGESESVDAVVLAVPAHHAAAMTAPLSELASQALTGIEFAGVHVIYQAFRREDVEHPLDGFGVLFPRSEGRRLLGTIWSSSTFDAQAPDGCVLLRHMMGGAHDPSATELSDDEMLAIADEEARRLFGLRAEPTFTRLFRWSRGIPQYNLGHLDRVQRAREAVGPGVFLTGNSVAGIGFNHCIQHAEVVAAEILDSLAEQKESVA